MFRLKIAGRVLFLEALKQGSVRDEVSLASPGNKRDGVAGALAFLGTMGSRSSQSIPAEASRSRNPAKAQAALEITPQRRFKC